MADVAYQEDLAASFRDPSGVIFLHNGLPYRQINFCYKENYDYLMSSGLYKSLTEAGLLIPHSEVCIETRNSTRAYKIIKPEPIPFISYPYEWCLSQLKTAALTTLQVQKEALRFGMSLKDCSAYNIQFKGYRPIFVDTLSFTKYQAGQPWSAYRQFCQHFLAPLALMYYVDSRLGELLRIYIDGIPLDLVSSILPFSCRLFPSLLAHIFFHAKSQKYFANNTRHLNKLKMSRLSLLRLIDNLESIIKKIKYQNRCSQWSDYYNQLNYSIDGFQHKQEIVDNFLMKVNPKNVWDLGANIGIFSRLSSRKGIYTISFDIDFDAVEKNYSMGTENNDINLLPLLIDLTNPSPALGWAHKERMSLLERGPVDTILALGLIHHLAISNNLPFHRIVDFFSGLCRSLIIEFIPKQDSQVQSLLSSRDDIFHTYTQENFEKEFKVAFNILSVENIKDSERKIYLMEKR